MATITTHIPSGTNHVRNALVAVLAALVVTGVIVTAWTVVDSESSSDGSSGTVTGSVAEDVSAASAADLNLSRQGQATSTVETGTTGAIKNSDQIRAEFEAELAENFVPPPAPVKTSDEVRAEFDALLRAQNPSPAPVKTSDEVRAEFEIEMAQKAAHDIKNSDQIRAEFDAQLRGASPAENPTPLEEIRMFTERGN